MRVPVLLVFACCALRADDRTQQLIARLTNEADAFRRIAPDLVGHETLVQRAVKVSKVHIRVGASAKSPAQPAWQERRLESEYSFAAFSGEGGALHEMRRVTAVDGKMLQDSKHAQEELAAIVTTDDDKRKKKLLEQFEKYGLMGAVTDFGQLLLLFSSGDVQHYEFSYRRMENQGIGHLLVFGYQQIDGPEGLTLIDGKHGGAAQNLRIGGEVWVRENDFLPVRVTLATSQGDGADLVREEASVEYAESAFGTVVPLWTEHREKRAGNVAVENKFSYADFHKFGSK
jgi:hypothetical protein